MGDLVSLLASAGTGAKRLVQVEFTSSTVWTVPSTVPVILVTAVGGGGGGGCSSYYPGYSGYTSLPGAGGAVLRRWPMTVKGTVTITIGAGGTGGGFYQSGSGVTGNQGNSGGDTKINDVVVGGGSGGYSAWSGSIQQEPPPGIVFDSRQYIYDGAYSGYSYYDRGWYASNYQSSYITKPNGVVVLVSGRGAGTLGWNGSSYYATPPTLVGQGGGLGSGYGSVAGTAGNPGYVMIEYFV